MGKVIQIKSGQVKCFAGKHPENFIVKHRRWLERSPARRLLVISHTDREEEEGIVYCCSRDEDSLKQAVWECALLEEMWEEIEPGFEEIAARVKELKRACDSIAALYSDTSLLRTRNLFQNLARSLNSSAVTDWKGRFSGMPAIVTGGGATLKKAIPQIKKNYPKALLFSGGAALPSLLKADLQPDFVATLDPFGSKKRDNALSECDAPLFYKADVAPETLTHKRKAKILVGENQGDLFDKWILDSLDLGLDEFDSGFTCVTFQIALAEFLGCSPIILAGVDLCGKKDKLYASDVEIDPEGLIEIVSEKGEKLVSRTDWLYSKEWIEKRAENARFQRMFPSELAFAHVDLFEKLSSIDIDKELISEGKSYMSLSKLSSLSEKLQKDIHDGIECVHTLLAVLESSYPNPPFDSEDWMKTLLRLERLEIYLHFLKPIWSVWIHLFRREPEIVKSELGFEINRILFYKTLLENLEETRKGDLEAALSEVS